MIGNDTPSLLLTMRTPAKGVARVYSGLLFLRQHLAPGWTPC